MRAVGMISGTSHDGIDVAVVELERDGDTLHGRIEWTDSEPYDEGLRSRLVSALPPGRASVEEVCILDTQIGEAFARAAQRAVRGASGPVDVICSHGQTVFHWVDGRRALGTLQLGQAAWIAEATGVPVVSDVRAADIAVGGQGAPLVPLLDRMILEPFRRSGRRTGALNLGGIANLTVCAPDADPVAWDIGPANALIDAAVAADPQTPDSFDRDGRLAASGTVHSGLLEELRAEPYYRLAPPKSSGKELFSGVYVDELLGRTGISIALPDLVATLTELTASVVADAVRAAGLDAVYASGGGVRNPALMSRIVAALPEVGVRPSEMLGVPSDDKEAIAFALLGWATMHGLPGNVPSCTGASAPRVLGRITPGTGPLRLPEPATTWPAVLAWRGEPA